MQNLNAADSIVLLLLRNSIWNEPIDITASNTPWDDVFNIAAKHVIIPVVWPSVRNNAKTIGISDEIVQKWRSATIASVLSGDRIMAAQAEALELLGNSGIRAVIHKGAAVARLYQRVETRPMGDIDILVHPGDYERAVTALTTEGAKR